MLKNITATELNEYNQKQKKDTDVLKDFFMLNEIAQHSNSTKIKQYFQNYYNELKTEVIRRDFIELYPEIEKLEKQWKSESVAVKYTSLSDNEIERFLSKSNNKKLEDFNENLRSIGVILNNETLTQLSLNKTSQNEFVNQKTVFNAMALDIIKQSPVAQYDIIESTPLANNEILNTTEVKPLKKWKPTV